MDSSFSPSSKIRRSRLPSSIPEMAVTPSPLRYLFSTRATPERIFWASRVMSFRPRLAFLQLPQAPQGRGAASPK